MKYIIGAIIWVWIILLFWVLGHAFDGRCPRCVAEGVTSKVYPGACFSTAMYCGSGYYDERGYFMPPEDCNHTNCEYRCSKGHYFTDGLPSPRVTPDMLRGPARGERSVLPLPGAFVGYSTGRVTSLFENMSTTER